MYNPKKDLSGQKDLSVHSTHMSALAAMKDASKQIQALPANPHAKKHENVAANHAARLNNAGANSGTDFSMFLLGGAQTLAMSLLTGGAALAGGSMISQAADVGASMIGESLDADTKTRYTPVDKSLKTSFARRATLKPSFARAKAPMQAPGAMATSMLMNASTRTQSNAYKKTLKKRRALEKRMSEAEKEAQVMQFYKQDNVYDIFDGPKAGGQKVKSDLHGQVRVANPETRKKQQQSGIYQTYGAKLRAGQAPGLSM